VFALLLAAEMVKGGKLTLGIRAAEKLIQNRTRFVLVLFISGTVYKSFDSESVYFLK